MSTTAVGQTSAGQFRTIRGQAPVPFSRLLQVEIRKQVDTRSGRALLVVIAALTALILIPGVVVGRADDVTFRSLIGLASSPQLMLLPVIGILAATSEWSQRTGLVTFALEPRRHLVILAKLAGALLVGIASFLVAIGFAAVAQVAATIFRDSPGDWAIVWSALGQTFLALVIMIAQGVGFGILLQNSAVAIVTFFVLPTLFSIVTSVVSFLSSTAAWYDLSVATSPLLSGDINGEGWAKLAVASLIWVVAPLGAGLVRVLRREVK